MPSWGSYRRIEMLPTPGASVYIARKSSTSSEVPQLFYDALAIRYEVFVKEQNCNPDEDIDVADPVCWHWVLFAPSEGDEKKSGNHDIPAATIRLVPASVHDHGHDVKHGAEAITDEGGHGAKMAIEPNYGRSNSGMWDGHETYAMIGRLATLKAFRGKGYGKILVEQALDWARQHPGEIKGESGEDWKGLMLIHAQLKVEAWYKSMGWIRDDGMGQWWEEGIEHVAMWKRVNLEAH